MDLFLLRQYDPHALEFVAGYPAVAAAAGFADHRYFRKQVIDSVRTYTVVGDDIISVHCAYGHFYILDGQIATHPTSGAVLGHNRRDSVTSRRKHETEGWRCRSTCSVSSGTVALR